MVLFSFFFVLSFLFCFLMEECFFFFGLLMLQYLSFSSSSPHKPNLDQFAIFLLNEVQHRILRLFKHFVITFFFQGSFH